MPYTMKIQPIDSNVEGTRIELAKPVAKSRLKRLFEWQFSGVLRNSSADKIGEGKEGSTDFEPSLAKMVQNFVEENHDDQSDALGSFGDSATYSSSAEILKGLVACASVCERNLLADTANIVEKNKSICKRKNELCKKIVTEGLLALGYDASICKSRWEKSPLYPAGEYEYIDVIIEKERVVVDVDFRSEFEIARPTKAYKAILQILPYIFVGKCDRLQSIVAVASEAAKQSLKKKGMHVPPWRKVEYVKAKWLSPYTRTTTTPPFTVSEDKSKVALQLKPPELKPKTSQSGLAAAFDQNP